MLTPESKMMYEKYVYFLSRLDEDVDTILAIEDKSVELDAFQEYFNTRMYIQSLHWEMKIKWKKYKQRRTEIIKQFEYGKYVILLRSVFCYDVKKIILSFLL